MARQKLIKVREFQKGTTRLAAIKSISPTLDLANGITAVNYETQINLFQSKLAAYNTALSAIDNLYNDCNAQLDVIKDWNERILTGVATKFGKKSSEYEMAGGVRKSEKKKPTPKTPKA